MKLIQKQPSDIEVQGPTVGVVERPPGTWAVEEDRVEVAVDRKEGMTFEMFPRASFDNHLAQPSGINETRTAGTFQARYILPSARHIYAKCTVFDWKTAHRFGHRCAEFSVSPARLLWRLGVGIMKENRFEVWWASGCRPGTMVMVQKKKQIAITSQCLLKLGYSQMASAALILRRHIEVNVPPLI
jgi:hypothetical protein